MKKWEAPKLIVLVRTQPAESLLTTCKVGFWSGPSETFTFCWVEPDQTCGVCYEIIDT